MSFESEKLFGRYSEAALGCTYDVLVKHVGARSDRDSKDAFVSCGNFSNEYRFQGSLGFGGKIWLPEQGSPYVTCYQEDETPERRKAVEEANKELKKVLRDALV